MNEQEQAIADLMLEEIKKLSGDVEAPHTLLQAAIGNYSLFLDCVNKRPLSISQR